MTGRGDPADPAGPADLADPAITTSRDSAVLPQDRRRLVILILAGVVVLGAGLRTYRITQPYIDAFSWRQSSTAMIAENFYGTSWNIFYPEVNWTGPGPNYQGREFQTVTYIAAALYTVFGQHDWVGRAVAVTFGVWGIVALFLLVRRVWDENRALAGAAFMAVLPASVFIDRSFLPDPAMVALMTSSLWLFVVYLQTGSRRWLLGSATICALGGLTKITGLIIGLPMLYALVSVTGIRGVFRPGRLAELGAFGLLVLTPVLSYYLWARHLALTYPPNHFAGSGNFIWDEGLRVLMQERFLLPALAERLHGWMYTAPAIVLLAVGLAVPLVSRVVGGTIADGADPGRGRAHWIFHWWLAAAVVYYVISAREVVGNPWNLHILSPAVAALAGAGAVLIGRQTALLARGSQSIVTPAVVLFLVTAVAWTGAQRLRYLYHPYAQASYELGLALRTESRPGDLVVTAGDHHAEPTPIYYSRRRGWVFPPLQPGNVWLPMPTEGGSAIRMLDSLRVEGARWFGLVHDHKERLWTYPPFPGYMESTCEVTLESPSWFLCRLRPSSAEREATSPALQPS